MIGQNEKRATNLLVWRKNKAISQSKLALGQKSHSPAQSHRLGDESCEHWEDERVTLTSMPKLGVFHFS